MEISLTLRKFGLNEKEIKIYLFLLENGPSPVRVIAKLTNINRGTTYDILKSLMSNDLISYYHKQTHQYFAVEDPEKLVKVLERKKVELNQVGDQLTNIIPELKSLYNKVGEKPVVKFYEGYKGVKFVLQDVLEKIDRLKDKEYYAFSSADIKNYLYKAFPDYNEQRIKKKIRVKTISLGAGGSLTGLDARKWLSQTHGSPSYVIIYGERVAMFSTTSNKQPIALIMEDKALAATQKMIFEFIWSKL